MTWLLAQVREWHNNGLQARLVGPTQKTQRRKHQEYRNTKVAGCKLPDEALSVREVWLWQGRLRRAYYLRMTRQRIFSLWARDVWIQRKGDQAGEAPSSGSDTAGFHCKLSRVISPCASNGARTFISLSK